MNGDRYNELGRMFADVLDRGWQVYHGKNAVSNDLPVAITGAALGLPGTEHKFMAVSASTRPFNYLGLPAISIPCGFDPNGCPIGLQIASWAGREDTVLRVANAFQRAFPRNERPAVS